MVKSKSKTKTHETSGDKASAPREWLLRAADLYFAYGQTRALAGASIDVFRGEIVALTGKSGSGKTSLLYSLAGIVRPDRGNLSYRGLDMTRMTDSDLTALRRKDFGFVFQFGELVPELTIRENVALPLRLNHQQPNAIKQRVEEVLDTLGIADVAGRRSSEVSGGQAQRAAIARALVHRPRVVFADEPTGSLDTENSDIVLRQFVDLARSAGAAVVLVTHEARVAEVADRRCNVTDGRVVGGIIDADALHS